mgnify:CR=1 FL=1
MFLVKTIYIGGGTPSLIDSKYIVQIIEDIKLNFEIDEKAEITIEVNPGTVTLEKLEDYKRQLTWFRKDENIKWIDGLAPLEQNIQCILEEYSGEKESK